MKAKKYALSMIAVYMAYLTHGIQALILVSLQSVLQSHGPVSVSSAPSGSAARFPTVSAVRN